MIPDHELTADERWAKAHATASLRKLHTKAEEHVPARWLATSLLHARDAEPELNAEQIETCLQTNYGGWHRDTEAGVSRLFPIWIIIAMQTAKSAKDAYENSHSI